MSQNGGYALYRAALADESAWVRARRPKRCKLASSPRLRRAVARKLRLNWSPEQIAGWLKRARPEDELSHVSHETIYRSLFVQARGVLKKELLGHLRSKRTMRRSRGEDPNGDKRGQITDLVPISQRPSVVEVGRALVIGKAYDVRPAEEALKLQRPLHDGVLEIVARGERRDEAAALPY